MLFFLTINLHISADYIYLFREPDCERESSNEVLNIIQIDRIIWKKSGAKHIQEFWHFYIDIFILIWIYNTLPRIEQKNEQIARGARLRSLNSRFNSWHFEKLLVFTHIGDENRRHLKSYFQHIPIDYLNILLSTSSYSTRITTLPSYWHLQPF